MPKGHLTGASGALEGHNIGIAEAVAIQGLKITSELCAS